MNERIAWLRAQLDEDERRVIAYRDGHPGPCLNYEGQDPADHTPYDTCYLHIQAATATPYRDVVFGLADIAAKRKILALAEAQVSMERGSGAELRQWQLGQQLLRMLAQPYDGRPGGRS